MRLIGMEIMFGFIICMFNYDDYKISFEFFSMILVDSFCLQQTAQLCRFSRGPTRVFYVEPAPRLPEAECLVRPGAEGGESVCRQAGGRVDGVCLYRCTGLHLYICSSVKECWCSGIYVYRCTCVQVYFCICVLVYRCTCVHVYMCTCVLVYLCTCVIVYMCINVHLHLCTFVHM